MVRDVILTQNRLDEFFSFLDSEQFLKSNMYHIVSDIMTKHSNMYDDNDMKPIELDSCLEEIALIDFRLGQGYLDWMQAMDKFYDESSYSTCLMNYGIEQMCYCPESVYYDFRRDVTNKFALDFLNDVGGMKAKYLDLYGVVRSEIVTKANELLSLNKKKCSWSDY